jgi:hypothetical protein
LAWAATQAVLEARITCPDCGFTKPEQMPTNACRYLFECAGCNTILRPLPRDCCVYCSYADTVCPPKQTGIGY